jgi:hypothetical protein
MGGIGSGRFWRYDAKDKVEDSRSIDVRRWQRDGLLYTGNPPSKPPNNLSLTANMLLMQI